MNSINQMLLDSDWHELKFIFVFCFLGYAMECSVFMKGTGIRFAEAGYAVFGIDYEGHGKSEGKRCYVQNFQDIVDDTIAYFKSVRGREELKILSPNNVDLQHLPNFLTESTLKITIEEGCRFGIMFRRILQEWSNQRVGNLP